MKAKLVGWLDEASGTYGDTVFREVGGKTVIARKPRKRKTPFTPGELEVQERFLQARDYANFVKLNPDLLSLYAEAAEAAGKSVYMLCREDWYKPPKVTRIDLKAYNGQAGDIIKFTARDEIVVVKATVTLSDDNTGALIEKGEAVPEIEGTVNWLYTATHAVPAGALVNIRVEAYDLPGNVGEQTGSKRL